LAVSLPVGWVPPLSLVPLQAPEAEQAATLSLVHFSVDAPPDGTVLGSAVSITIGADPAIVTVAVCVAELPGPVHVSPNSVMLESAPVDQVPLVAKAPFHPPEAVQAVALVVVHCRLDTPPFSAVGGQALNVMEGATLVWTAAEATTAFEDVPFADGVSVV